MKIKKLTVIAALVVTVFGASTAAALAAPNSISNGGAPASTAVCPRHGHPGGKVFTGELAKILGVDESTLRSELKSGKTLAQIASAKGISSNILTAKIQAMLNAKIDQAVQKGKLPQEKAAKLKTETAKRAEGMVNKKWTDHPRKRVGIFRGVHQQIPAILGMDSQTLKTQLKEGKSLAEIAKEKGVSTNDLASKIQAAVNTNLDQAVKDGKLSAGEANKIKSELPTKIQQMLNHKHVGK